MAITHAQIQRLTVDPDQLRPGDHIWTVTFVAVDEKDRAIPVLGILRTIHDTVSVY